MHAHVWTLSKKCGATTSQVARPLFLGENRLYLGDEERFTKDCTGSDAVFLDIDNGMYILNVYTLYDDKNTKMGQ